MFVLAFLLKGGLYQMTFLRRFRCEFAGLDGSSSFWDILQVAVLKWLRLRALLYSGAADSKAVRSDVDETRSLVI